MGIWIRLFCVCYRQTARAFSVQLKLQIADAHRYTLVKENHALKYWYTAVRVNDETQIILQFKHRR